MIMPSSSNALTIAQQLSLLLRNGSRRAMGDLPAPNLDTVIVRQADQFLEVARNIISHIRIMRSSVGHFHPQR
jgi:hypothetical protein